MTKSKLLIMIVIIISFIYGCNKNVTDKEKINVACNLPLTGDLATYGESIKDGMSLAVDDIEKSKGKDSLNINFVFDDNQGIPKNTASIFQKQTTSRVDFYVSAVTPQTMSIIKQVNEKGIPHFAWAWQPFITRDYNNTFRTWVNFEAEAGYYIKFVEDKKPKKIAIAHMNVTGPVIQFNDIVIPKLKELGYTDINTEVFEVDKLDFKDIVNKFKSYNPDVILMSGFKDHVIGFVKACRDFKLIKDNNTMISMDLLDASEDLSPDILEGISVTVPTFLISKSENYNNWNKQFQDKYKRKPRYTDSYAYDMVYIINEAVSQTKRSGKQKIEYSDLISALMQVDINGITGKLRFSKDRDLLLDLKRCSFKNGALVVD